MLQMDVSDQKPGQNSLNYNKVSQAPTLIAMKIAIKRVKKGKCFPREDGADTLARADGWLSWWQKQTQPSLPFSELRKKGDMHRGPRAPAPPYPQSQAALRCNQGETLACSWLEGEREAGWGGGDRAGQSGTSLGCAQVPRPHLQGRVRERPRAQAH